MNEQSKQSLTRRDFGKLTAAASFAAWTARNSEAQETNSDTLKVGLLGCGGRAGADLVRFLAGNENVKVIAMADLFQDHLDAKRAEFTNHKDEIIRTKVDIQDDHCFVGWEAYRRILETDIDVILDCTTPYCRPKHVEAAVEAKKNIFAEKPIAVDPVGVRRFMDAMKKHKEMGLSFVAGTQFRHDGNRLQTLEKIRAGAIGDVVALRSYYCGGLPFVVERDPKWGDVEYQLRNWYNYCWCAGDNIVEQAIHGIDHCNWVMDGPPVSVFASGGRAWKPRTEMYGDLWDNFSCDYVYAKGVHLAEYCRHWDGCDGAGGMEIVGAKGVSNGEDMGDWTGDMTEQEHKDLVNSIRKTGPYVHEGQRIAESTLTAIMGRMSAYTGKRITWEQALNSDLSLVPDPLDFEMKLAVGEIPVPNVTPGAALKYR
jgi:predicted dehydrogenase